MSFSIALITSYLYECHHSAAIDNSISSPPLLSPSFSPSPSSSTSFSSSSCPPTYSSPSSNSCSPTCSSPTYSSPSSILGLPRPIWRNLANPLCSITGFDRLLCLVWDVSYTLFSRRVHLDWNGIADINNMRGQIFYYFYYGLYYLFWIFVIVTMLPSSSSY